MNPRKSKVKKWTALPKELVQQIGEVVSENFSEAAKVGQFTAEGRIYPDELLLRLGYLEKGRLAPANFEISLDFNASKENALKMIHVALDCAASMFEQYLEAGGDTEIFPRRWEPFDFDGKTVYLQLSTVNSSLDAEADRLLGIADDSLVQTDPDEDETESREAVISMLGLSEDDPPRKTPKSDKKPAKTKKK